MATQVSRCNFGTNAVSTVVIQSFNGPDDLLVLDAVDQVDTTQFDGSWTSPYWPTLKTKYDLVMPGELPSGGAPAGGATGPQGGGA